MKNLKTIALALLVAFGTATVTAQTKKVDVSKSQINWVGKKVTGQHEGTINLQDGALVFKGKKLTGGNFTVNMTTISATDLSGKGKASLDGHLKAEDFFGTDKYPTSKLVFKTIADKGNNTYTVTADLTIKEITNPITFDVVVNKGVATTKLIVDRTKYDIKYGSGSFFEGLGDKTISDNFELNVNLQY
ncbi:YceI family protein [Flavobacterium sp. GT3R68]|uniref:YceI family protein n=1 Tax=Flavobacterium sp. GT3R68 TaxID=2594437 RepID=UPI000F86B664|nr:YceI family protein [Flavobacterium sp. GT3R68]RTY91809.1 YceI family protein [Flavobacterium sp. GSN2]TRW90149.1 YceI family protein [Flavobacterium sp. GT3R68]